MRSAGQAHPTVFSLASSTPRDRQQVGVSIMSAWTRVREAAFAPAEAMAGELCTASTPDLAMLVVARCQLRQALG